MGETVDASDAEESERAVSRYVTPALLVAIIPGAAYLLTYLHQAGYAAYFGIPVEVMPLSISRIFETGGVLLVFAAFLYQVAKGFMAALFTTAPVGTFRTAVWRTVLRVMAAVLAWVVFGLLVGYGSGEARFLGLAIVILSALYGLGVFVLPLFRDRQMMAYKDRVARAEQEQSANRFLTLFRRRFGYRSAFTLVFFLVVLISSYYIGEAQARAQVRFYVVDSQPAMVVLVFDNDKVLGASFDAPCHAISRSIQVLPFGQGKLTMTPKDIGPLTPGKSCHT